MLHSRAIGQGTYAIVGCLLCSEILLSMIVVDSVCFSCHPSYILHIDVVYRRNLEQSGTFCCEVCRV